VSIDSGRSAGLEWLRSAGPQRRMRSVAIVIGNEFADSRAKVPLVDRNDKVQTLAPDGSDDSFAKGVCGRRPDRSPEGADTEISQSQIDSVREGSVAVVDHESVWVVVGKKLAELLNRPFRGWVIGHIDMQHLVEANLHRDENVDYAKRSRHGDKEIAGDDSLRMVTDKRRPTVTFSAAAGLIGVQVFPHGSRRDSNSEFDEQLVGDVF
jgi:hypothetical protein